MNRKLVLLLVVLSLVGIVLLSGCVRQQSTPQTTKVPTVPSTQQTQVSITHVPITQTVKPTVKVTIPVTGVFIKVSYVGAFNGTYGMNGAMKQVNSSGDRIYEITNATGNVAATFFKQDESTTHEISVELFKNGISITSAKNSTSFGKVSISYKV